MFENTLYTIDITSNYFSFTNNIFPLKFYDRVFFSDSLAFANLASKASALSTMLVI